MTMVVLDANVLGIAKQDRHPLQIDAVNLLCCFRQRHTLALDANGELMKQYRRCLGCWMSNNYPPPIVHTLFYKHLYGRKRTTQVSAKLSAKQKQLLKSVKFHCKDYILVAIALRTKGRLIVTEDKGLHTPEVLKMLKSEFYVEILGIQAALQSLAS